MNKTRQKDKKENKPEFLRIDRKDLRLECRVFMHFQGTPPTCPTIVFCVIQQSHLKQQSYLIKKSVIQSFESDSETSFQFAARPVVTVTSE